MMFKPTLGRMANEEHAMEAPIALEALEIVVKHFLTRSGLHLNECLLARRGLHQNEVNVFLTPADVGHALPAVSRKDQVDHRLEIRPVK